MTHGRKSTYDRHKCRCGECRAANTQYQRERRAVITHRDAVRARRTTPGPLSLEAA